MEGIIQVIAATLDNNCEAKRQLMAAAWRRLFNWTDPRDKYLYTCSVERSLDNNCEAKKQLIAVAWRRLFNWTDLRDKYLYEEFNPLWRTIEKQKAIYDMHAAVTVWFCSWKVEDSSAHGKVKWVLIDHSTGETSTTLMMSVQGP